MVVNPNIDRVQYGEDQPDECTYIDQYPPQEIKKDSSDKIQKDTTYNNPDNPKNSPMLASTTESIKDYLEENKDVIICDDSPEYTWGKKGTPIKMAIGADDCPYVAFRIPVYTYIRSILWVANSFKFRIGTSYLMCNIPTYGTFYYPVSLRQGQNNTWEWIQDQEWLVEGVSENYGADQITGQAAVPDDSTNVFYVDGDTEPDRMCPPNFWSPLGSIPSWKCEQQEDFCGVIGGTAGWVSGGDAKIRTESILYYVTYNATNSHPDPQNRLTEPPLGPPEFILKGAPNSYPATATLYDKNIYWPFEDCDGEYLGTYIGE